MCVCHCSGFIWDIKGPIRCNIHFRMFSYKRLQAASEGWAILDKNKILIFVFAENSILNFDFDFSGNTTKKPMTYMISNSLSLFIKKNSKQIFLMGM